MSLKEDGREIELRYLLYLKFVIIDMANLL